MLLIFEEIVEYTFVVTSRSSGTPSIALIDGFELISLPVNARIGFWQYVQTEAEKPG